jgi:hypothetical protein
MMFPPDYLTRILWNENSVNGTKVLNLSACQKPFRQEQLGPLDVAACGATKQKVLATAGPTATLFGDRMIDTART